MEISWDAVASSIKYIILISMLFFVEVVSNVISVEFIREC